MGISCSACLPDPDHHNPDHGSDHDSDDHAAHRNGSHHHQQTAKVAQPKSPPQIAAVLLDHLRPRRSMADDRPRKPTARAPDQYDLVSSLNDIISKRLRLDPALPKIPGLRSNTRPPRLPPSTPFRDKDAYDAARKQVVNFEGAMGFDYACTILSSDSEKRASLIVQRIKELDVQDTYAKAPPRKGYGGQLHSRFYGDHFLSNASLIEDTKLYKIIHAMPKGAHLHIHFNANLLPGVLIDIAKGMDRMFITSDIPLARDQDPHAFDRCKIQFSILCESAVKEQGGEVDIFDANYPSRKPMRFRDFRSKFGAAYRGAHRGNSNGRSRSGEAGIDVDDWLKNKLVFGEEETHNSLQTANGAWELFNGRTQMMKGLFNYETAYTSYTKLCLQEFVDDNIQYAEIRPNFMATNQVWKDDGSSRIDNEGILNLITSAYEEFQQKHDFKVLKGLKIIYCTPRSFDPDKVKASLDECLKFKKERPEWIAGFDLVGEESKGRPLKDFVPEFLEFQKACRKEGVEIPFLFHCGETLDIGADTDGNLVDALLLDSKRIGHGFALPRHPYVLEQMKKRNICVEVCPISNEILGLTPRINGHAMYGLLANNVHCTVSTDNGTLFRSRLSHDFYQTMAGKSDMTLHGFRQLIEWSLEHSCLEDSRRADIRADWEVMWNSFCQDIIVQHGHLLEETTDSNNNEETPDIKKT